MDLKARLAELARIQPASTPVVSVYLNTHWADEHQRDRVRIFLKNELARAREARFPRPAEADLGVMVALRGGRVEHVPMTDVLGKPRRVDPQGECVTAARDIGTIFGDEVRG